MAKRYPMDDVEVGDVLMRGKSVYVVVEMFKNWRGWWEVTMDRRDERSRPVFRMTRTKRYLEAYGFRYPRVAEIELYWPGDRKMRQLVRKGKVSDIGTLKLELTRKAA